MARKKVTPEEEIVNTAVEGTALGSVPADTAPPDETGAIAGDFPAELPEGVACGGNGRAVGNASCNGGSRGEAVWTICSRKNCIPRRK